MTGVRNADALLAALRRRAAFRAAAALRRRREAERASPIARFELTGEQRP